MKAQVASFPFTPVSAALLEQPTDDSIEIAVGFIHEVGVFLSTPKTHQKPTRLFLSDSLLFYHLQFLRTQLFLLESSEI